MMAPYSLTLYLIVALFGLIFGSFLNVCIARLPSHQSVVAPRSHCMNCGKLISWYDNIPVLSYVVLRGRCRRCRHRISLIYPLVEIITAGLFVAALASFGLSAEFVKAIVFSMLMVVLIFTDYTERLIPHSVTIFGIVVGLAFSLIVPVNNALFGWIFLRLGIILTGSVSSLIGALTGGIFGAGLLYGVAWFFRKFGDPQKEYLGFGDVMLMLVVGVFLGIPLTYLTILLGSLAGTLVAIPLQLFSRTFRGYQWPYGSFLAAAAIFCYFRGHALLVAYLRWSGLRS